MEDKLPAILGLATKFYQHHKSEYFSGLWKENLPTDLAWARDNLGYLETRFGPIKKLSGPTFSWASVPGPVTYRLARTGYPGSRIYHTRFIQAYYPYKFASKIQPRLRLCGPTMTGILNYSMLLDERTYSLQLGSQIKYLGETVIDAPITSSFTADHNGPGHRILSTDLERRLERGESIPIKLLDLFTLQDGMTNKIYDLIVILAKLSGDQQSYRTAHQSHARQGSLALIVLVVQDRRGAFSGKI